MRYHEEWFKVYECVNREAAARIANFLSPGDVVWVHDYHFLLLGQHLRRNNVRARLGFFLHIPFPAWEVFSVLPNHREILESLCTYNVVGFQTATDLNAFLRCLEQVSNVTQTRVSETLYDIRAFGRSFSVGVFPISIDTAGMAAAAEQATQNPHTLELKQSLASKNLIIGVDRLDYTKGLPQRLEAFQHFLQTYPNYDGKVQYVQITPPSRSDVEQYKDLQTELETLTGCINGMHANIGWQPVHYLNKSFTRDQLAGFYRLAKVGLVTPLHDGMNLVAKEYVASQDPKDPGVLILSRFAGAAEELKDGALLINPHAIEDTAEKLRQALIMPREERIKRHSAMMAILNRQTINHWTQDFLSQLYDTQRNVIPWPGQRVGNL
jgi:trehalose 6-phosphate synthase